MSSVVFSNKCLLVSARFVRQIHLGNLTSPTPSKGTQCSKLTKNMRPKQPISKQNRQYFGTIAVNEVGNLYTPNYPLRSLERLDGRWIKTENHHYWDSNRTFLLTLKSFCNQSTQDFLLLKGTLSAVFPPHLKHLRVLANLFKHLNLAEHSIYPFQTLLKLLSRSLPGLSTFHLDWQVKQVLQAVTGSKTSYVKWANLAFHLEVFRASAFTSSASPINSGRMARLSSLYNRWEGTVFNNLYDWVVVGELSMAEFSSRLKYCRAMRIHFINSQVISLVGTLFSQALTERRQQQDRPDTGVLTRRFLKLFSISICTLGDCFPSSIWDFVRTLYAYSLSNRYS